MKTKLQDVTQFFSGTRSYTPTFNSPVRYVLKDKQDLLGRLYTLLSREKPLERYDLYITERILELPFVHRALNRRVGDRILEFGCVNSISCIELASRGMRVTGVDLRPYPLSHPNFEFYQGDLLGLDFPSAAFDAIIAVSAVEHVGLGAYGEDTRDDRVDYELMKRFFSLLKPEGQLIVTVPFGAGGMTKQYRIYNEQELRSLLEDYVVDIEEYYRRLDNNIWLPVSRNDLADITWTSPRAGAEAVVLIAAHRPIDSSDRLGILP